MHPAGSLVRNAPGEGAPRGFALFAKGFRPFFLLAGLFAAIAMPLWVAALRGRAVTIHYFAGAFWHAHEMLFGFTLAVIAGFLLTAVGNWTQRETAVGGALAALAGLWVLGRVVIAAADHLPGAIVAAVDIAFVPAVGIACARPIFATANRRNYAFVAMLALLSGANVAMHLGALGVVRASALHLGASAAVYLVIAMILVMTTRIVPMFTRNATGIESIRNSPALDRASIAALVGVGVLDVSAVDPRVVAAASLAAALLVMARTVHWGTRHVFRQPLLWILHVGHAFVAVGLALRALGPWWTRATPSAALHALTAGAIGSLTLGMMARVSLGHTGRVLKVPTSVAVGFVSVCLAASLRVVGVMFGARGYVHVMEASGTLFAVGFALYVVAYARILVAPRVDGKPG